MKKDDILQNEIPLHEIRGKFGTQNRSFIYPGSVHDDLEFKHDWEKQTILDHVVLTPKMKELFANITSTMFNGHQVMKKERPEVKYVVTGEEENV